MHDASALIDTPLFWPVARLIAAYRTKELSPVEVCEEAQRRADAFDKAMNIYVTRMDDLAMRQAKAAEAAYRNGTAPALAGVPVSIKDAFEVKGYKTTWGSLKFRDHISKIDTGVSARLRASGAVLTGKTNTAEFGQSATTDNLLGPDTTNAWDPARTSGGSSGGAVSSVAAGLASIAVGSDGGGSIRIPAAFSGVFGIKPTYGLVKDEGSGSAMSDFVCPGPLARSVDDARHLLNVLAETDFARAPTQRALRIAWCRSPERRPIEPGVMATLEAAVEQIRALGHEIVEDDIPVAGWKDVFGPLVLFDELRERGHYLDEDHSDLTEYELATLLAARKLTDRDTGRARDLLAAYRARIDAYLDDFDAIITPTNAVTAFPVGDRPTMIEGRKVSELWGAFPFTSPFNVAGTPAASVPCGLAGGLPVGLQVVMKRGADAALLDLCEDIEEALACDMSALKRRWALPKPVEETS